MKKQYAILLICLSGILFPFRSSAQDEVFPTKDAIWNICVDTYPESKSYFYGLTGDTVIDNQTYNKLYLLNDTLLQIDSKDIYVGGIRQSDKKVYMKPADTKYKEEIEEFLMYDFSAKKGDILNMDKRPFYYYDFFGLTFENVDIYNLANHISRSARIEDIQDTDLGFTMVVFLIDFDTWIEGIGSLSGLFFTQGPKLAGYKQRFFDRDEVTKLACLKVGDKIRYQHPECKECMKNVITGLDRKELFPVTIRQIGNRQLLLQSSESDLPLQFEMLSLSGQVMQSQIIREAESRIELRVIPGIYLYRLIGDRVYKSDKIVVR
ncbi:hypothetical protein [Coprobacter sp.]